VPVVQKGGRVEQLMNSEDLFKGMSFRTAAVVSTIREIVDMIAGKKDLPNWHQLNAKHLLRKITSSLTPKLTELATWTTRQHQRSRTVLCISRIFPHTIGRTAHPYDHILCSSEDMSLGSLNLGVPHLVFKLFERAMIAI
jgi:hypothetical protein